jgi:hypothetical protein
MVRHCVNLGRGILRFSRKATPPAITPIAIEAPRLLTPFLMTTGYYLHCNYNALLKCHQQALTSSEQTTLQNQYEQSGFWQAFAELIISTLRFFQLLIIFSPVVLALPLKMFDSPKDYWYDLFVS